MTAVSSNRWMRTDADSNGMLASSYSCRSQPAPSPTWNGFAAAEGYKGLQFTGVGQDFPVIKEIQQRRRMGVLSSVLLVAAKGCGRAGVAASDVPAGAAADPSPGGTAGAAMVRAHAKRHPPACGDGLHGHAWTR